MKLTTLRRTRAKSLPGVTAVARVDRRTRSLSRRLRRGEIAVVDHIDMDRDAAVALVEAGVRAVVNAAPTVSGRYPSLGAQHLVESGVLLVDDVGNQVFAAIPDGARVRIDGASVYLDDDLVGSGVRQDRRSVADAMERSKHGIPSRLEALSATAVEQLRQERDLVLDGVGVPKVRTAVNGRHVLVVVKAFDYRKDLASLRHYIADASPVLIGVDGGADALIEAGHRPDIILCDGDDVSDAALRSGAEVVVKAGHDGRAAALERVDRLGIRHTTFATGCATADAALLIAHAGGAGLIVTVGAPSSLEEMLDKGRSSMASSFLTRAAVGARVADAKAVAQLYTNRLRGWLVIALIVLALALVAAALATTPVGQDWWDSARGQLGSAYDWVTGHV